MVSRHSVQSMHSSHGTWRRGLARLGWGALLMASALFGWFAVAALGVLDATPFALPSLVGPLKNGLSVGMLLLTLVIGATLALTALIALARGTWRTADVRRHVLVSDELGFVFVDTQGVEAVACAAALRAPGVVEADVEAHGAGGSPVRLAAFVGVHPGASIEVAGRSARTLVRQAVEELVGLRVSDVVVSVHVLSPEDLGRVLR